MYNLIVDTAHTFFVGDGQWLVHNTDPSCYNFNMPTASRHNAERISPKSLSRNNVETTVATDWDGVRADITEINEVRAIREGDRFITSSGRIYKTDGKPGHIYPVEGPGLYNLNAREFQALGLLNTSNGNLDHPQFKHDPKFTQDVIDRAYEIWRVMNPSGE